MRGHYKECATLQGCSCEERQYLFLFLLGLLATAIQTIGVLWQGSLSLAGDTAHVATDTFDLLLATIIAYKAQSLSHEKEDRLRKFAGYASAVILCFVAFEIVTHAFERLETPRENVYWSMIIAGSIGLVINLYQMTLLRKYPHENVTYRRIALHVGSDMWISVAVVGGGVAMLFSGVSIIDPLASIVVAVWLVVHLAKDMSEEHDHEHNHHH